MVLHHAAGSLAPNGLAAQDPQGLTLDDEGEESSVFRQRHPLVPESGVLVTHIA